MVNGFVGSKNIRTFAISYHDNNTPEKAGDLSPQLPFRAFMLLKW